MLKKQQPKKVRNKFTRKGFSFMEVMMAVFLIVVGVLASVTLLSGGLRESLDSRSQLTAVLLAQEGVELVRNIRDNNWIATAATFENFPETAPDNCIIGLSTPTLVCGINDAAKTLYLSSGGLYDTTQTGNPTKFKRKIVIDYDSLPVATATYATVTSMTIWGNYSFPADVADCNSGKKCAFVEVTLTNWGEKN